MIASALAKAALAILEVAAGELGHIDRKGQPRQQVFSEADKRFWHGALWFIANERARSRPFNTRGWVYHKYLDKFGHKPPWDSPAPVPPSQEIRAWVRSRDIAFAKAMAKQGTAA